MNGDRVTPQWLGTMQSEGLLMSGVGERHGN